MTDTPGKRILLHAGAPWAQTGYGQQCAQLAPRLRDAGHNVVISATWGLNGASLGWDGITVFPSDDAYGNRRLADYAAMHQSDLVISLTDVWVFSSPRLREIPLACWVPVDHKPCPPAVAGFFKDFGARPIAMSRFGESELRETGLDPVYVPHAIDTTVFAPQDRALARAMFKIPEDAFLVGMVANNAGRQPSRKAFPQALMAFAQLRAAHPDARLYLHTELTGTKPPHPGVNMIDLFDRYGIPVESVHYTDPVTMDVGLPPSTMASMYSAFDVLLNPSYGEGFGVPIVEAQACGTPVIATDWTSMSELVGAGWLVGGEPWDDVDHRAFYLAPSVPEIVAALEDAYQKRGDVSMRERAREFAVQYDADKVFDKYWKPALEKLTRPREVAPLPGMNREQRRRMAKQKVTA